VLPIEDKFGGDIAVAGGDMMPIELRPHETLDCWRLTALCDSVDSG
jgi:hypothetical protein